MWIIFFSFFVQESYYVDGMEFYLSDGTRIMTLSDVQTDLYHYFWYEEGAYISIPKNIIKKVDFFSFRELGRKPKDQVKNIHQRRIRDRSVVFQSNGKKRIKVIHVNAGGKSLEGILRHNRVSALWVQPQKDENVYHFNLDMVAPNAIMEFHFYSMKGKPVATAMVDLEMFPVTKKEKKSQKMTGFFHLPADLVPEEFGLVEVVSNAKKGSGKKNEKN